MKMKCQTVSIVVAVALSFLSLSLVICESVNAKTEDILWYTVGQADYMDPNICLSIIPPSGSNEDVDIDNGDDIRAIFDLYLFTEGMGGPPWYLKTTLDYQLYFCPVDDNNTAIATSKGGCITVNKTDNYPRQKNVLEDFTYYNVNSGSTIYVTAVFLLEVWDITSTVIDWITETHYYELNTI